MYKNFRVRINIYEFFCHIIIEYNNKRNRQLYSRSVANLQKNNNIFLYYKLKCNQMHKNAKEFCKSFTELEVSIPLIRSHREIIVYGLIETFAILVRRNYL